MKSERNVLDLKRQVWSPNGETRASAHLLNRYITEALVAVQKSETVVITGSAPTWLYLAVAHALAVNGHCKHLIYNAPSSGDVTIFDYGGD